MKIAVVKKNYDPCGGGAERYTAKICGNLVSRGHKLSVFSESFRNVDTSSLDFVKVPRSGWNILSPPQRFHSSFQSIFNPSEFDLSYAVARTFPADIFRASEQLHAEWMKIAYHGLQEFNPRHRAILKLEKMIYRPENTRAVVTNSELVKRQIIAHFGYPAEKIFVIRNGIDRKVFYPADDDEKAEARRKLGISRDSKVILFSGGNFKVKGLEEAIIAFSKLDGKFLAGALMIVCGRGGHQYYTRLAGKLGCCDKIRFEGDVANMREYYVASDLFLFPTRYEPFSNVCLEAAACRIPFITTAMNGASEIISGSDGGGYVVQESKDIAAMTENMDSFFSMAKSVRANFADAALRASMKYDWDRHAEQLESLFCRVLEQKRDGK